MSEAVRCPFTRWAGVDLLTRCVLADDHAGYCINMRGFAMHPRELDPAVRYRLMRQPIPARLVK